MQSDVQEAKAALRKQIRAVVEILSLEKRAADSAKICALLRKQAVWKNARSVLLFAPMPAEPDLWPLLAEALAAGKTAALPRYQPADKKYVVGRVQNLPSDIVSGAFGIREPGPHCPELPPGQFDLILAPGLAFDLHGKRLGRGRGFYDRLLAAVPGAKCGVAFDEQIVREVPIGSHDIRMNCLLTPTRWIKSCHS
jgi:5-formyltetrahydrofolate cyclo-ligase